MEVRDPEGKCVILTKVHQCVGSCYSFQSLQISATDIGSMCQCCEPAGFKNRKIVGDFLCTAVNSPKLTKKAITIKEPTSCACKRCDSASAA